MSICVKRENAISTTSWEVQKDQEIFLKKVGFEVLKDLSNIHLATGTPLTVT